ncbi:MAG: dihydroneopterin aldolase [Muribaculaceae bacterium]|nr:dihydroneopterin aldolase [Muribaculaceae bacterium]
MMPEFEIQLRDVLLFANHGVMPEEGVTGNQYRVNVRLRIDAASFEAAKDDLGATVSYADVFDVLRSVMSVRVALLETVAVKFAQEVRDRWPVIKSGWIEIVKTVPPIPHMIGEAGVRYDF